MSYKIDVDKNRRIFIVPNKDGGATKVFQTSMIDLESHRFDCLKDNTCYQNGDRIFDGRNDKIRDIDGKALAEWANSGGTKIEEKADLNPEQQEFVDQL